MNLSFNKLKINIGIGSQGRGLEYVAYVAPVPSAPPVSTAAYAANAGYANSAGSANTANSATNAGYANNANYANTAGYANSSGPWPISAVPPATGGINNTNYVYAYLYWYYGSQCSNTTPPPQVSIYLVGPGGYLPRQGTQYGYCRSWDYQFLGIYN